MEQPAPQPREALDRQRWRLVHQIAAVLDRPMTVLAFVWLGLLIIDFTQGLSGWLETLNWVIWGLFALHFGLEFLIAPDKVRYLRKNWLTAVALVLPAFRIIRVLSVFRVLRAAQAARAVGLLRLATSMNRGLRATRKSLRHYGVPFVIATHLLVIFGGAAGMYFFERPAALREAGYPAPHQGMTSYGEALWWTAIISTTMGPEYWPKTTEGRVLMWIIAAYAFAVFGYITAAFASRFLGTRAESKTPPDELRASVEALREELGLLRAELARRP